MGYAVKRLTVVFLFAGQLGAKEFEMGLVGDAHDITYNLVGTGYFLLGNSMEKMVAQIVDKLLLKMLARGYDVKTFDNGDKALNNMVANLHPSDMDNTTFGKPRSSVIPHYTNARPLPRGEDSIKVRSAHLLALQPYTPLAGTLHKYYSYIPHDTVSKHFAMVDIARSTSRAQIAGAYKEKAKRNIKTYAFELDEGEGPSGIVLRETSFDMEEAVADAKDSLLQVVHDPSSNSRSLWFAKTGEFYSEEPDDVQPWSHMGCGPINTTKKLTCEEQECCPSEDPMELVQYLNARGLVSVGPSILGSRLRRVAIVGIAGGMMVHFLHRWNPFLEIDAVEYSAAVAEIAKSCFAFPKSEHVKLHVGDGLEFLARQGNATYDLIIIDVSNSQQQFATPEAHLSFMRTLKRDGLLTWNSAQFSAYPELVEQGLSLARHFWKYAYASPDKYWIAFSNTDIADAIGSMGGDIHNPGATDPAALTPEQKIVPHWFGEGVAELWNEDD